MIHTNSPERNHSNIKSPNFSCSNGRNVFVFAVAVLGSKEDWTPVLSLILLWRHTLWLMTVRDRCIMWMLPIFEHWGDTFRLHTAKTVGNPVMKGSYCRNIINFIWCVDEVVSDSWNWCDRRLNSRCNKRRSHVCRLQVVTFYLKKTICCKQ